MHTECNSKQLTFQGLGNKKVIANFDGGTITSDAGALLLREIDLANHFLKDFANCFQDNRDPRYTEHSVQQLVAQRILGICLGSQLLARVSYEFGTHPGLGWIEAEVVRLEPEDSSLRVPHVGWDDLVQVRESVLYDDVPQDALFYYVHSFHIKCDNQDIVIGMCDYGGDVTAAFQQGNIYGTQFHPEKSQRHGLTLLGNFLDKA